MPIKKKTWELAGWSALIASAGFLVAAPIFLAIIWMQKEGIWQGSLSHHSYGKSGGQLIILALPSLLLLWLLKKDPRFKDRLSATTDELKPVMYMGFGIAGVLFFTFLMALNWFDAHGTARFIVGLIILWSLMFATVAGFCEVSKKA